MNNRMLRTNTGVPTRPTNQTPINRAASANRARPRAGGVKVDTGQVNVKNPTKFWDRKVDQGTALGKSMAPELYDGSLSKVEDQYQGQNQEYMNLLNDRMRNGMSAQEINQIEDRGMSELNRATAGAMRTGAQSLARGGTGMSGGAGNALQMDLARGIGSSVRGLQSDIAGQNMAYKQGATGQYGGALDSARTAGLNVSKANTDLERQDLAARIGMTGTGMGLFEQTRQEGRADKQRDEDMKFQKEIEQMKLNLYKQAM